MKFHTERNALADAVTWTAKSLPTRPSVPIIAGVLMHVADGTLTISGFDYEKSTQATISVTGEGGTALVSGRLLAEIVKALPAKPIEATARGAHLELVCGSARFTLPTMPVEDYPALPAMPETAGTVDALVLARAITQAAIATSRDVSLPMLTGIKMETDNDTLTLMASDRYRASVVNLPWCPNDPNATINALVPGQTLADIAKSLTTSTDDVTIALSRGGVGEGLIGFVGGSRRTTSRLLDPEFPKVRTLFPAVPASVVTIDATTLAEVVKRVALVADPTTPVRLTFTNDEVIIEAGGSEDARASESTPCALDGDPITVALNPKYLAEAIGVLGGSDITLSFTASMRPVVFAGTDTNFQHLIMPMRIGG